ncbi:hypothetical protein V8E36_003662 [Tilletia maclaganii]
MDTTAPYSSAQAAARFVAEQLGCPLANASDGTEQQQQQKGEDDLNPLIDDALRVSAQDQLLQPAAPLGRLLHALIRHQVLFPLSLTDQAIPKALSHLAAQLPEQLRNAVDRPAGTEQATELALPSASPFESFLADTLWTVDTELELVSDSAVGISKILSLPLTGQVDTRSQDIRPIHQALQDASEELSFDEAQTRLASLIKHLVQAGHVSRPILADRLELPLLHQLGLLPEKAGTVTMRSVRINTSINYKQDKYNLLREENEGYTALIKLILESIGPALKPVYVLDEASTASSSASSSGAYMAPDIAIVETESAHARIHRVSSVLKKIRALVGFFNLDSSRVLDVLLDVMGLHLAAHWPFFCSLLELSTWGAHLRARGSNASADQNAMDVDGSGATGGGADGLLSAQRQPQPLGDLAEEISNLPTFLASETGNSTCAQLLGFKFRDYQRAESSDVLLEELYLLTALLVQRGFVRLLDLVPHLAPDAAQLRKQEMDHRKKLRIGRRKIETSNALVNAAPLVDDTLPGSGATRRPASGSAAGAGGDGAGAGSTTAEKKKDGPNQIVGLTRGFLAIGSLRHAWFFLGRSPWLLAAHPDLADAYCRLLKVVLAPAYRPVTFSQAKPWLRSTPPQNRFEAKSQQPGGEVSAAKSAPSLPSLGPLPTHALDLTLYAPEPLWTAEKRFVFFYPFWTDELPSCSNPDEFFTIFLPMLKFLGPFFYRDLELYSAICRMGRIALRPILGKRSDQNDGTAAELSAPEREVKERWLDVVKSYLLPAHAMTDGLAYVGTELWRILSFLDYQERYALYGEWKYRLYLRDDLTGRRADAEKEARGVLRRISKDSDKAKATAMGKKLAKAAHSNPIIFFSVALQQVQAYDNFAVSLVECLKFASLTPLEADVFMFVLLDALSDDKKDRLKSDGLNTSLWLASLATFSGILLRRCDKIDPAPLLQYVVNSLVANNTNDIVIVRELIKQMSGFIVLETLDDRQVDALFGGRLLRVEAMIAPEYKPDTEGRGSILDSGERLLASLKRSKMGVPLLVLLAQMREGCVFAEEMGFGPEGVIGEGGRKAIAAMFDSCQMVLFQFIEFLQYFMDAKLYADLIPSLEALVLRYGLSPAVAFYIARPNLRREIDLATQADAAKKAAEKAARKKRKLEEEEEKRKAEAAAAAAAVAADGVASGKAEVASTEAAKAEEAEDVEMSQADQEDANGKPTVEEGSDNKATPVPSTISALPTSGEEPIAEVAQAEAEAETDPWMTALEPAFEAARKFLPPEVVSTLGVHFYVTFWQLTYADLDVPSSRYTVETSLAGRKTNSIKALREENMRQMQALNTTRLRLMKEKMTWFPDDVRGRALLDQIVQYCIHPRALLSTVDAIFAARFMRRLHAWGTPNVHTIMVYDRVFLNYVTLTLFSCTEAEAKYYGRFLLTVLEDVSSWAQSESRFEKEVLKDKMGADLPGFRIKYNSPTRLTLLDFQQICDKWHDALRQGLQRCLESKDYLCRRNTIAIANMLTPCFPRKAVHGDAMIKAIQTAIADEAREDVRLSANGLLARYKAVSKNWQGARAAAQKSQPPAASSRASGQDAPPSAAKDTAGAKATEPKPATAPAVAVTPARANSAGPRPPLGLKVDSRPLLPDRPGPTRTASSSSMPPPPSGPAAGRNGLPPRPGALSASRTGGPTAPSTPTTATPRGADVKLDSVADKEKDQASKDRNRERRVDDKPATTVASRAVGSELPAAAAGASGPGPSSGQRSVAASPRPGRSREPSPASHSRRSPEPPSSASGRGTKRERERDVPEERTGATSGESASRRADPASRESEKDRDKERDRERDRESHRDRDRDRGDREHRTRDRERDRDAGRDRETRDRHRDGERERDRDRDRDRSDRDKDREKDRRERDERRDRDPPRGPRGGDDKEREKDKEKDKDKEKSDRDRNDGTGSNKRRKLDREEAANDRNGSGSGRERAPASSVNAVSLGGSRRATDSKSESRTKEDSGWGKSEPRIKEDSGWGKTDPRSKEDSGWGKVEPRAKEDSGWGKDDRPRDRERDLPRGPGGWGVPTGPRTPATGSANDAKSSSRQLDERDRERTREQDRDRDMERLRDAWDEDAKRRPGSSLPLRADNGGRTEAAAENAISGKGTEAKKDGERPPGSPRHESSSVSAVPQKRSHDEQVESNEGVGDVSTDSLKRAKLDRPGGERKFRVSGIAAANAIKSATSAENGGGVRSSAGRLSDASRDRPRAGRTGQSIRGTASSNAVLASASASASAASGSNAIAPAPVNSLMARLGAEPASQPASPGLGPGSGSGSGPAAGEGGTRTLDIMGMARRREKGRGEPDSAGGGGGGSATPVGADQPTSGSGSGPWDRDGDGWGAELPSRDADQGKDRRRDGGPSSGPASTSSPAVGSAADSGWGVVSDRDRDRERERERDRERDRDRDARRSDRDGRGDRDHSSRSDRDRDRDNRERDRDRDHRSDRDRDRDRKPRRKSGGRDRELRRAGV